MKTLMVTGGSGLIGSALIPKLLSSHRVISVDIRPFPIDVFPDERKFFEQKEMDISELQSDDLRNIDGIIHLAAISRVITAERTPLETWRTNVECTQHLLNLASVQAFPPWIIYSSSREVYGEQDNFPVDENYLTIPINRYGVSKLAAEGLIRNYSINSLVNSIILRLSNVYGSCYDHLDRVIPKFIQRAFLHQTLELHGSANSFDFTHVKDTVSGFLCSVNYMELKSNSSDNLIFNICTGIRTTLKELSQIIINQSLSTSDIVETQSREFDVCHFQGSYAEAKIHLGYKPNIPLSEGISKLITQLKPLYVEVKSH